MPLPRGPLRPRLGAFDRVHAFGNPPDYEPPPEQSVAAIAQRQGQSSAEAAYELMLGDEGRAYLYAPSANYADGHLDACRDMLAHPHTVPGLGEGGAHVSIISEGSLPNYLLAHRGRDRAQG